MTTTVTSNRTAAAALAAGAGSWVLVGFVHPTARGGNVIAQLARLSPHAAAVHLLAIAAAVALLFGSVDFSVRRGLGRSPVLAALIVFALATCAFIAAATLDGFVVPGIATLAADSRSFAPGTTVQLLTVCSLAVQQLTKGGILAVALAISFWSYDLARERDLRRSVGLLGFTIALGCTAAMLVTARIVPQTIVGVGLLQLLWYAAIAALLATERV